MMRTKYINYYCHECAAIVDHVKLSYVNQTVLVCMLCQNETVQNDEGAVEKSYTLMMIDDKGYFTPQRRTVVVELLCRTSAYLGNSDRTEIITVGYTAYGGDHFTASLTKYPGKGFINHKDAAAIAREIKKFIKEE